MSRFALVDLKLLKEELKKDTPESRINVVELIEVFLDRGNGLSLNDQEVLEATGTILIDVSKSEKNTLADKILKMFFNSSLVVLEEHGVIGEQNELANKHSRA